MISVLCPKCLKYVDCPTANYLKGNNRPSEEEQSTAIKNSGHTCASPKVPVHLLTDIAAEKKRELAADKKRVKASGG